MDKASSPHDPPNSEQPSAADIQRAIGEDVDRKIAAERLARELALSSQDHRLLSSITTLIRAVLSPESCSRRERIMASATAIGWCLVPTTGTAAIGIVALASLLIAWQQARLLSVQNDKIEVQNLLSEAQRRSALLFETTAIFQTIDEEKKTAAAVQCSKPQEDEKCWHKAANGTPLFNPSAATIGRIAALTQALRPYRYLSVEDARPYRFVGTETNREICPHLIQSETQTAAAQLFTRAGIGMSDEDRALRSTEPLKAEIGKIYAASGAPVTSWLRAAFETIVSFGSESLASLTLPSGVDGDIALNCAPASPERGQLLVSLHAASIDISRIANRGGDFRYADLPGAYLKGIALTGVDLSFTRLPGANFGDAVLNKVSFQGAHLSGTRFGNAHLIGVTFAGAIIQTHSDGAASAGPFTAGIARENDLTGMRFIEQRSKDDLHSRICIALKLLARIRAKSVPEGPEEVRLPMMDELQRFAVLVEIRQKKQGGQSQLIGTIVPKILEEELVLFERSSSGDLPARLEYSPFSLCRWPASAANGGAKPDAAPPDSNAQK